MDLTEARGLIKTERLWLVPGAEKVFVGVRVRAARVSYGRTQLQVEPLSGRGVRWVDVDSTTDVED